MIGRPSGRRRLHAFEAQRRQAQRINEGIDRANGVVLSDIVVNAVGEQRRLLTGRTLDEALHPDPPRSAAPQTTSKGVLPQPRPKAALRVRG